jgi:imidazole glycerol-phosphate synthase subunit HisH
VIAIIDYGLGNARAFHDIYYRLGIPSRLARSASDLSEATHIILPGVGAFDWAMNRLHSSSLGGALTDAVIKRRVPLLGICVGMQMLANKSEEGQLPGLGWIAGEVRRFPLPSRPGMSCLPHMGWNDVDPLLENPLFADMNGAARFYFLHSYFFAPADPVAASCFSDYHGRFACAVSRGNIHGVQFHPEKSHEWGVKLLRNFAQIDLCSGPG